MVIEQVELIGFLKNGELIGVVRKMFFDGSEILNEEAALKLLSESRGTWFVNVISEGGKE